MMENTNQTTESVQQGTEDAGQGSPPNPSTSRIGSWAKNTIYGFAGLVILALVITVVSPETAVAVSQYLPKEYQETIFATSATGETCSAGMPVGGYSGCCHAKASGCAAGSMSCPMSAESEVADDSLAADIPSLSLDNMLAGLND
ncbi:hypothetical protein Pan97_02860 [Bremerella volcania]|uniref:Uncharacterized protein n=1 Tax=Bremerella volcania TaxID=2527984 RepID=A0A518C264_9BACT|nr:hypothetical protein [Bremerella volcania]QDU73317.1 hypothetical protein Pan97_02860 [Bremerella volcania]